jgi:hypothetical protein
MTLALRLLLAEAGVIWTRAEWKTAEEPIDNCVCPLLFNLTSTQIHDAVSTSRFREELGSNNVAGYQAAVEF